MLTSSVDNVCGLSNGAFGALLGMVYDGASRAPDLPSYVVADMPNYKGVEIYDGRPTWVAISPEENTLGENRYISRTMLPLRLAYASRVRRAHGLTLENGAVIGLAQAQGWGAQKQYRLYHLWRVRERPHWALLHLPTYHR